MKWVASLAMTLLAAAAAADCPWDDDAAMATALSDTRWHIKSMSGMRVQQDEQRMSVSLVAELDDLSLFVGPFLQDTRLGDRRATLTLIGAHEVEDARLKTGRHEMVMPFPEVDGTPCGTTDLSMLLLATDHSRHLDTWMMLRAADDKRLIGVMKIAGARSTNGVGAGIYRVEATPAQ